MAWVGLIAGLFGGLLAAVLGYTVFALPLWLSLALYPLIGSLSLFATIGVLLLRGRSDPPMPPAVLAAEMETA
ncbi:hypothetical protein [Tropicibacter sp. Alg240-R139]|uniref:hypothetical protein n=1 Tax=Tropicibacter sp. Alg240-R139 TaxID=2305991 RepID=UPI0013DF9CA5|nr:hypothetical protein [Tropicibacter sp. Alg240-R139]